MNLGFYTADASTHRWTFSFTLRNSGSGQLVLNGTPAIYVTGPNVANFTVLPPANFALSPGSSTTMTLAFLHPRNASNGNKSATISIPNSGGTTFTFLVNVNSTAAPALKVQYYASYKDPAVPTYGVITSGSTANLRYLRHLSRPFQNLQHRLGPPRLEFGHPDLRLRQSGVLVPHPAVDAAPRYQERGLRIHPAVHDRNRFDRLALYLHGTIPIIRAS